MSRSDRRSPDRRSPSRFVYPPYSETFQRNSRPYNLLNDAVENYNSTMRSAHPVTLAELSNDQPEQYFQFAFSTKSIASMAGFLRFFRERLQRPDLDVSMKTEMTSNNSKTYYYFQLPRQSQNHGGTWMRFIILILFATILLGTAFYLQQ